MEKGHMERKIILTTLSLQEKGGLIVGEGSDPTSNIDAKNFLVWYKNLSKQGRYRTRKAFSRLRRKKVIDMHTDSRGYIRILLTELGIRTANYYKLNSLVVEPVKRWDKKWRVVLFNISSSHARERILFQKEIKRLHFKVLQKGVWISPFPCELQIKTLQEALGLEPYVTFIETSKINSRKNLKSIFEIN